MSAPDLQSLWMIEEDLEKEFARILAEVTGNVHRSREGADLTTPWLEIQFNVGQVNPKKQWIYPNGRTYYNTWQGSMLELKVCTNRGGGYAGQGNPSQHKVIIGRARSLVQLAALAQTWAQECHAITDIREAGTVSETDTENDLDYTTISFSVVHNIKDSAWPL